MRNPVNRPLPWNDRQIDEFAVEPRPVSDSQEFTWMPHFQTDLIKGVASIIPSDTPILSDDECLVRLAQAVEDHDTDHLDELARLIGRLAVTIE